VMAAIDPAQQEQAFITSVRAVFYRWTVLRLAVQNGWGPAGDPNTKEENMIAEIIRLFGRGERVYIDEIQDMLEAGLDEYFETIADDGSAKEVGQTIISLYSDISVGNFANAEAIVRAAQSTQGGAAASMAGKTQLGDDEEDDDEEGGDDGDEEMGGMAMEPRPKTEPTVDEDGFTMVTKKGNRR